MDFTAWALYALIAAAALGAVTLHYRLREPAGRGRGLLAVLRWLALALLLLLLFDPDLPAARAGGARGAVLLDGSLSMMLPAGGGESRWDVARRIAAEADADRVLVFGSGEARAVDGLDDEEPDATGSRLAPALRAAAEAGFGRVLVVTDAALEDAGDAVRLAREAGVSLEVRRVGEAPPRNAGIVEVEAPAWLEVGVEATLRVAVGALGMAGDSVALVLHRGDRELARTRVEAPPDGRLTGATLRFEPATPAAGPVRLDVGIEGVDAAPADDRRSVYVRISAEPAGVTLVSFRPDQEPRFLLPVLERALGLPVRGWMALPEGRFIQLGLGPEAGLGSDAAAVRRALREADLVVLHGLDESAPEWARDAAARAPRLLVFPGAARVPGLPFAPGPARPGDWYPVGEIPPSPVAPLLAGVEPGDVPPLSALRTPDPPPGFWSPLNARAGRRGEARPVVLAGLVEGRRIAVALGDGYWRWAFAGQGGRAVYDRLWSATGAWLVDDGGAVATDPVFPLPRVVARGDAVRFRAPAAADSVRLLIRSAAPAEDESAPALDTVLAIEGGLATARPLPPGHYRYEARLHGIAGAAGGERAGIADTSDGELTVESYSPEFTRPAAAIEPALDTGAPAPEVRRSRGRPLRASAWPYVALVLLLCAEWVLRRRWGLR